LYHKVYTITMETKVVFFVLLINLSVVLVSSEHILYHNCTRDVSHVFDVEMSPCPKFPCVFEKGQTVDVKIKFTAENDSPSLDAKVYGLVLNTIPIPYPLPNGDGCNNSGIICPVQKGVTYTYHGQFKVEEMYPAIQIIVRWKLIGAHGTEACFTFPMEIIDHPDAVVG